MAKRPLHANRLLKQLSPRDFAKLEPELEPVTLAFKEPLYEENRPISHVYFVTNGMVSLVTDMTEPGSVVETGTIGREGMVGIPALLGASVAPGRAFVQVPGAGLRMPTARLLAAVKRIEPLQQLLLLYTNALMSMVAQSAACNRAHLVTARMARWLLMTHDRVDGPTFPLTQEFLGQMLGVQRPAVNQSGRALQREKLIEYKRGKITILDRAGLESTSCECYAAIVKQMARVRLTH